MEDNSLHKKIRVQAQAGEEIKYTYYPLSINKVTQNESGVFIDIDLKEKDFFIMALMKAAAGYAKDRPELKEELATIKEAIDFFGNYITSVTFKPLRGKKFIYSYAAQKDLKTEEEITQTAARLIEADVIKGIIEAAILIPKKKGVNFDSIEGVPKEKTWHKQSRSNLRTVSRLVGRDTSQSSLFSLDLTEIEKTLTELERENKTAQGLPIKEIMSQKVGILSLLLLQKWASNQGELDEENYICINDPGLSKLARELNTDTKELKYYLLYLVSFQYPIIKQYEEKKQIGLGFSKMFDIEFIFNESKPGKAIQQISTQNVALLLSQPIVKIKVRPCEHFIRDLAGKKGKTALGYVKVSDSFISLAQDLSMLAFKLQAYISTQPPEFSLKEEKLIKWLGLQAQYKQQRKSRMREKIELAFEELKASGFLLEYKTPNFGAGEILYSWKYTKEYITHQNEKKTLGGANIEADQPTEETEYRPTAASRSRKPAGRKDATTRKK